MQTFKKIIILFWTLWWGIALWTDVVGGLAHLGWLHASWALDANYPFLVASLKMYSSSQWLPAVLFAAIIIWSLLNTLLFIYASLAFEKPQAIFLQRVERAFIISLGLWLCFFLADQLVMKYDEEENHMVQGGFQLLTFLCFYLLPEKK